MDNDKLFSDRKVLIDFLKKGDDAAFKFLYKENYWLIFNLVNRFSSLEEDFKDVFQETIIAFYENLVNDKFKQTAKISTYLYAIARNICTKKFKKTTEPLNDNLPLDIGYEKETETSKEERVKHYLLNELKEECRKLLVLFYYEQKSLSEIAGVLNFTPEYAKNKKRRCMNYFRKIVIEKEKNYG